MPTRRGWLSLGAGLALWAAARVMGSPELHMVAVGVLVLPILAVLYVHWNRARIEVHRNLSQARVFPRTRVTVRLRVQNTGAGGAPFLLLEDALPPSLGTPARLVVAGIPGRGEETVSYSLTGRQRGRYVVGPASIYTADPFGLANIRIEGSSTNDLVVYPEVEEIDAWELALQGTGTGESTVRQLHRSVAEFYTMREYVTGDDLRRIHWPSVAKTGNLMIRQDESTRRSAATIFLDNRTEALGALGSPAFELAVSVAASVGRALIRAGFTVSLGSVDFPTQPMGEERLLETLAGAVPSRTKAMAGSLARLRRAVPTDSTLVLVAGPPVPADVQAISRSATAFGRKLAILIYPVDPATLPPGPAAELEGRALAARSSLASSRWDVYLLQPHGRLADAWKPRKIDPRRLRVAGSFS